MLLKRQSVCVYRYIVMGGVFAQSYFRADTPFIPLSRLGPDRSDYFEIFLKNH
jgi:hypothetical protein